MAESSAGIIADFTMKKSCILPFGIGKLRITELFRMSTENSSGACSKKFNRAGKSIANDLKLAGIVYLLDVIGIDLSSTSSNKDCAFKLEKAIKKK